MQILSSTTASERSTLDKRSQSFSVEKRFNATNGNATKWSANNHKPDAADGESNACCRLIEGLLKTHLSILSM